MTMPGGPRWEDDFYAWTQHQAEALRSMPAPDWYPAAPELR